jgi:hypothetical protein
MPPVHLAKSRALYITLWTLRRVAIGKSTTEIVAYPAFVVRAAIAFVTVHLPDCAVRAAATPPTTRNVRFADRTSDAHGSGRFRAVLVQSTLCPLRLTVRLDRTVRVFDLPSRRIGPQIGPHEQGKRLAEAGISPCENPREGDLQFDRFMGVSSLQDNLSGLWHGECWPPGRRLAPARNRAVRLVAGV